MEIKMNSKLGSHNLSFSIRYFAVVFLIGTLTSITCWADDFSHIGQAIDAVTQHHFAKHPPKGLFSIARVSGFPQDTYKPVARRLETKILSGLEKEAAKNFVPVSELRIPKNGELDPKDRSGKTYRGIEFIKTGECVDVFYISQIEYIDSKNIKVHYSFFNGPLAAYGGSYLVRVIDKGFEIKDGEDSWVS